MIIAKWNQSVILTYLGVTIACTGIFLGLNQMPNYAYICLILAGICDMFDGVVARLVKRTEEEKQFGIELDSLADMVGFIALPIILAITSNNKPLSLCAGIVFAICGIARLAHFNTVTRKKTKRITYYQGLPVTFSAMILPIAYIISKIIFDDELNCIIPAVMFIIAALNILDIKIPKPRGLAYGIFSGIAIALIILLVVL